MFSDVAYKARDREDLIAGVDEFLDEVIVLPPGEWDPKIRIEPPKKVPSAEMRHVHLTTLNHMYYLSTWGQQKQVDMVNVFANSYLFTYREVTEQHDHSFEVLFFVHLSNASPIFTLF